jgi:quercetin dioxygenase-like cupin family protein
METAQVVRLKDVEPVSFGPDAFYHLLVGDEAGSTPIRVGIQTSEPGYVTGLHAHPYVEVLHVLEGTAEAWLEGQEDRPLRLEVGDTITLPPDIPHAFRVVGDRVLRTLGVHASPKRISRYRDGQSTDARGYPARDATKA